MPRTVLRPWQLGSSDDSSESILGVTAPTHDTDA